MPKWKSSDAARPFKPSGLGGGCDELMLSMLHHIQSIVHFVFLDFCSSKTDTDTDQTHYAFSNKEATQDVRHHVQLQLRL